MLQTTESVETLTKRQQEMEDHALALGGQRFRKKLEDAVVNGTSAQAGAAKKLLSEGLVLVEEALRVTLVSKKGAGRPHQATRWVRELGVDTAAYLSLKVVLDNIHGRVSVRRAAYDLTELIIDELKYRRFKREDPRLFEYVMTGFTTSSYAHRARSLDARIHREEIDVSDISMTQGERFTVGVKLLDVVREVTGLVEVSHRKERGKGNKPVDVVELVATQETLEWLKQRNDALEFLWPVNLPMVMPPLPWAPGRRGGYRFALRGKHKMVRSSNWGLKGISEEMENSRQMPAVFAALNRIQETPWRINLSVLGVIEQILQQGGGMAGVPPVDPQPLPPKPHDIDTNPVATKAWRKAAHQVHESNHEDSMRRAELFRTLNIVGKVKEEAAIWFPHNLDFRGRVYPVTNFLHPQGDDMCKGLLHFAEGKELGRDGIAYLALHGANSLGKTLEGLKLSHMTLQERINYVLSLSVAIQDVAADPLNHPWWMEADDKWQFLAFCFDWAGFCAFEAEGRGDKYVSSLPVAMDGTCNGLQHFAAMWLDPVGGAAVNVVPSETPKDIYQAIADVVLEKLEAASGTEPLAMLWLRTGIVDRKLTKRPTMTFGYGSQQFGFGTQLKDYVNGHEKWKMELKPLFLHTVVDEVTGEEKVKSSLQAACTYMAGLIWSALETVAVSAFAGMAWMRSCAKAISKDAKTPVQWVVPGTGFKVVQAYMQQVARRNVRTVLAGKVFAPDSYEDTKNTNWKKQTSSVAPNIVHSLDASALMMTVNSAADAGIQHFAMVHDSYGTLAADAPVLASCTRQAFFGLYSSQDVVNNLWSQFSAQVDASAGVEVPVPPEKGSDGELMDLAGVMLSDYFFS